MSKRIEDCEGCKVEMQEAYDLQQLGYGVGLDWYNGHCFFYAIDKKGEWIAG